MILRRNKTLNIMICWIDHNGVPKQCLALSILNSVHHVGGIRQITGRIEGAQIVF